MTFFHSNSGYILPQKGMVLLVTLTVIVMLLGVTITGNWKARYAVNASEIYGRRLFLIQMAEAGLHAAMALLVHDRSHSEIDSVQEDWADSNHLNTLFQDLVFENGKLQVAIHDEMGRLPINALVSQPDGKTFQTSSYRIWQRFLEQAASRLETAIDPDMILNSMKDWMDSGDGEAITGQTGAESLYYMELYPPYPCKNGPIDHPSELLRIRGFTDTLFHGNDLQPGIQPFINAIRETLVPGRFGKININTADSEVLAAILPPHKSESAREMVEYRTEKSENVFVHDLSNPLWYKQIPGWEDVVIPSSWVTLSSDVFRIVIVARTEVSTRTLTAVIIREKDSDSGTYHCRILYRESDF